MTRSIRRAALLGCAALAFTLPAPALLAADRSSVATLRKPAAGGAPWLTSEVFALGAALDRELAGARELRGAHAGLLLVDSATGALLYARGADDAYSPASNLKVLTGSAALDALGPAFRFRTTIEAGGPVEDGILDGELIVRGGGDPLLRASDLDAAAAEIARSGITSVRGGITTDATRFDDEAYPQGWTIDDVPYSYSPAVSALCLEENTLHLTIRPGALAGDSPSLVADPPSDVLAFENRATTGAAQSHNSIDFVRERPGVVAVAGAIPLDDPPDDEDVAVPDPQAYAADVFARALHAHGVAVAGGARALRPSTFVPRPWIGAPFSAGSPVPGMTPPAAASVAPVASRVLWSHESEPLAELLADFWYPSDNLVGEVLLKELGRLRSGAPGRTEAGISAELQFLARLGVPAAGVSLFDGSGLSRYDRITPRAFVAILQHDWSSAQRDVVLDALPVAGVRGDLRGQYAGTPLERRVFAKTGSYLHTNALSGYLATEHHGSVTFSFLVDDWLGTPADLRAARARILGRVIGAP
jgi:D-alanyl-D-alanine carboxypeptidase/D-alanyl-D-alanine-endopeptidase (penicillin-binding protein 4)